MVNLSLVQKMTQLSDKLTKIPVKFGIPQYKSVQVVKGWDADGMERSEEILPTPQVLSVGQADLGRIIDGSGVTIGSEDRWIIVSRTVPADLLLGEQVEYWCVTDFEGREARYSPVYVDTTQMLTYRVLCTKYIEQR